MALVQRNPRVALAGTPISEGALRPTRAPRHVFRTAAVAAAVQEKAAEDRKVLEQILKSMTVI